jgi:hypothetical protein
MIAARIRNGNKILKLCAQQGFSGYCRPDFCPLSATHINSFQQLSTKETGGPKAAGG